MRDLIQKEVDGRTYEFEQYTTTLSLKTLARLAKIVGEPLAIAVGGFFKDGDRKASELVNGLPAPVQEKKSLLEREIDGEAIQAAVGALLARLDESEVVSLVKLMTAEKVLCDNKPVIFDTHYQGQPLHLFKVLKASIEAQYGNFFDAVKDTGLATAAAAQVRPVGIRA